MKTYQYIKEDKTIWWFFYDRTIKLWTVFEVAKDGTQISQECDYYQNKKQLTESTGFNFKNCI